MARSWLSELYDWLDGEPWLLNPRLDDDYRLPVGPCDFRFYQITRAARRLPDNIGKMDKDAVVREFYAAIAAVLDCDDWANLPTDEVRRLIHQAEDA